MNITNQVIIAITLGLAYLFTQWLHGGFYVVALSWPLFFSVCIAAMLAASELFKAGRVPNGWLPALILIFLSIYGLSRWFFDSEPARGFLPVVNLLAGALAFSAVLAGIKSTSARVILVLILVLGGVLQAIQIALWRSFGSGIETPWFSELLRSWYEGRINPRLSGSYMSRNNTVWALNSSCLFCLALCIWARWPAFLKFLCGWFSGLLALTSFLTLSRGGILGLALGFSLFLGLSLSIIIKSKGRFRIAALAMTIILLIGVVGAGSWFLANNFLLKERVERVGEDAYRSEAWKPLLRQIQLAPLWGTGPGSTAHWMRILHSPQLAGTESIYAHNDWLEFTAEGGIFALVLLLVALSLSVSIALHGIHSRLISKPDYGIPQSTEAALGIGALCSIAAFAIHSFFDYNMQLSSNSLLAFLILGIAVGTRSPQQAADELDRANPILSTSLSASSLFLLPGLAILLTFRNFHDETRATQIDNAIRLKRPEIALALAKRVEISDSRNANLHTAIADAWLAAANSFLVLNFDAYPKAKLHRKLALENMPRDRFLFCLQANTLSRIGLKEEARQAALEAIGNSILMPLAYEYAGWVEEFALDWSRAARFYRLAAGMPNNYHFASKRYQLLVETLKANSQPEPPPWLPIPQKPESYEISDF